MWDGSEWSSLGDGVNGQVRAILVLPDGDVYVGGGFTEADGQAAMNIARWDGESWSALGDGINNAVVALAMAPDGTLYVGGRFDEDRKSTRLNSSHVAISYAVFC